MFTTKRTNTRKKKYRVFLFIHIFLYDSARKGQQYVVALCVPQLALKSANFLIGQFLISVDVSFPLLRAKQTCVRSAAKKSVKYIELRQC